MIYLLSFIVVIGLPVFLHELGHFLAARSVGIKVEKFYIGFNLFGLGYKKKYKDFEYRFVDDISFYVKRRLGILTNSGLIGIFLVFEGGRTILGVHT